MGIHEDMLVLTEEIGPRGATTAAEGRAARYIRKRLEERGIQASTKEFFTINTYSYLYVIYLLATALSGLLSYWFPYYAAPVALACATLFALDLETYPLLSSIMPRRLSRNVVGEIPSEDGKVGLVLVAHYDSARASLSFHPRMVRGFRFSFQLMVWAVFATAALTVSNLILRVTLGYANLGVWIATLLTSCYLLVPVAVMLHRERYMAYTPGANDNASGVATMLALADKMSEEESLTPGVMFVATGAEEVGTVGMLEFVREHGERIRDAMIINLDNLGRGHLCYIDCEGMLAPRRADPVLLWLAGKVVERKRLPVFRTSYRLLSTDATPALARGFRAMSVMAFDDDGTLPNWHWKTDTLENVNIQNLETARAFVWNIARRLDLP